jgi:8-oxo-dGTP diphosphatase
MSAPVRVACALIERDGRVLVARRPPGKALALKWEFPGGKIEARETGAAALRREIREELGVEIETGRALPAITHDYGAFAITLVPFVCRLVAGEPHPHEHVEVRWCAPEEVAALDLAQADRPVLDFYLRARAGEDRD